MNTETVYSGRREADVVMTSALAFTRPMAILDYRFRIKALVIVGVLAALLSLIVDNSVGLRPLVWLNFKYGTVVIHVPWLIALFFISAVATFLAKRNGARLSQCLLVGISPALIIGTLFSLLMAVIVVMAASGGRRVYPRDFIGHMLVSAAANPEDLPSRSDDVRRGVSRWWFLPDHDDLTRSE